MLAALACTLANMMMAAKINAAKIPKSLVSTRSFAFITTPSSAVELTGAMTP
jgi:hypothetical protein